MFLTLTKFKEHLGLFAWSLKEAIIQKLIIINDGLLQHPLESWPTIIQFNQILDA